MDTVKNSKAKSKELMVVITSIQPPTTSMRVFCKVLCQHDISLLVVGDQKGPYNYFLPGAELLTLEDQCQQGFKLGTMLPKNHYARKNMGYLTAIRFGARCIYETDDDNTPLDSWCLRPLITKATKINTNASWINVYNLFSDQLIWPRGFPLKRIHDHQSFDVVKSEQVNAPIQQGLVNGSPDVDSIWRMVIKKEICFKQKNSVLIPPGTWAPFNTQSTWWWPKVYALMYLPVHCSFRATDIWRSMVAQRCLWELNQGVVFHGPEVIQHRNQHDLLHDFEDEIPLYLQIEKLASVLKNIKFKSTLDLSVNLRHCYKVLTAHKFFPETELKLVDAWLQDIKTAKGD